MSDPNYSAPAGDYRGAVYRDGIHAIVNTAVTGALTVPVSVAAGSETLGELVDKNVLALAGVVPMLGGDGIELTFAKSGTITSNTFLVVVWKPIVKLGKIVGFAASALCDIGATLTYGAGTIGAGFVGVGLVDGTAPTTAPAGTEVWATGITFKSETVAVTTQNVLNNADLIKTAAGDAGPCTLRITPLSGVSHVQVLQSTGGGGGTQWCFANRTRGGSLNTPGT